MGRSSKEKEMQIILTLLALLGMYIALLVAGEVVQAWANFKDQIKKGEKK